MNNIILKRIVNSKEMIENQNYLICNQSSLGTMNWEVCTCSQKELFWVDDYSGRWGKRPFEEQQIVFELPSKVIMTANLDATAI